ESFGDFDHAVNVAVGKLRIALGDSADVPRYVETLHRRGYRFIAKVEPPSPSPNVAATQAPLGKLLLSIIKWPLLYGVVAILALACAAIFYPRHRQPLGEKDSVVLGDFSNSTGDSVFDGSLREGLAIELEQSPFLNLTSEERIRRTLRLMDQPADAKLTPGVARELCQRIGSAAVLDGSIAQIGSQYLLTLRAINCISGESLASSEAQARDKDHVLDVLGRMASEIRSKLGESLGSVQKFDVSLEQATTPSLDALQVYSAGVAALRSRGETAALPLFKRAVDLDRNFAMAYSWMAVIYYNLSERALAAQNATAAYTLRGRVTERERLFIDSRFYDLANGDVERATQVYEQWRQAYPRDSLP